MAVVDGVSSVALRGEWWLVGKMFDVLPDMSETTWSNLLCETDKGFGGGQLVDGLYGSFGRLG